MPIDVFLFDLDGTLVDSIPDLTRAINLLREELDLPAVSSDQVRSYVGDGVGLLLQRALPDEHVNPACRKRFMEIYTEHLTDETVIYPGIINFLEIHRGKPMAVVTNKADGLFPAPREIALSCSCPDWATMCKHVAAALYGVGARLDRQSEMLFTLRGVDPSQLVEAAVKQPPTARRSRSARKLATEDLSSVFGVRGYP